MRLIDSTPHDSTTSAAPEPMSAAPRFVACCDDPHWLSTVVAATDSGMLASLGVVLARGEHHTKAFELVRPGIDIERERAAREAAGEVTGFEAGDLYPDARPCLEALSAAGYRIGIAGNYSPQTERTIRE